MIIVAVLAAAWVPDTAFLPKAKRITVPEAQR
jgi:hypothetical protein